MEFILAVIIAIGIIAFVAYPLFGTAREETAESAGAFDELVAQRNAAYDAIRDLDLDFQMGKLSEGDYRARRDKYVARAAHVLQEIDALDGHGAGKKIEEEVAQLRASRQNSPLGDEIEREVARLRESKKATAEVHCANCGTLNHAGDGFCSKCGSSLAHP